MKLLMIKRRGDRKNFARSFVMFRSCKHMNKEFNLGRCKQKIPFVKKIGIPSKRLGVLRYEFNEHLLMHRFHYKRPARQSA